MNAAQEGRPFEEAEKEVMNLLKSYFRPEFLNRVDDIVFFKPLTMDEIKEIARLQLSYVAQRLSQQQINVEFADSAIENIAKVGFDPELGARPLRRGIQKEIENRIAEKMVLGEVVPGDHIKVDFKEGSFTVEKTNR
jgi:ATP-dependent Clp protease ATP-binding subunit ClpA